MKKILIALSIAGFLSYTASAQTEHSQNDINYKVCRTHTGYKVCSGPYNGTGKNYETRMPQPANTREENNDVIPLSKGRSPYDINYKVCKVDERYKVCNPDEPVIQQTARPGQVASARSVNTGNTASLSMMETQGHAGYTSKKKSNVKVWDEDNVQEMINKGTDGIDKAKTRNLNYNNGSVSLPPSDGGLSDRK